MPSIKKLPMYDSPLKYNQFETNVLTIILSDEQVWDWVYNNFIHIVFTQAGRWGVFLSVEETWLQSPFIRYQSISGDLIGRNYEDFITFAIRAINMGYYMFLNIDTFYVSNYMSDYHGIHCIFVFGYNKETERFNIADFFSNGKYQHQECTFRELFQGYLNFDPEQNMLDNVVLMSRREKHMHHDHYYLNKDMIKLSISDYLKAEYPFNKYNKFENPEIWFPY